jgi:hypothetical protein
LALNAGTELFSPSFCPSHQPTHLASSNHQNSKHLHSCSKWLSASSSPTRYASISSRTPRRCGLPARLKPAMADSFLPPHRTTPAPPPSRWSRRPTASTSRASSPTPPSPLPSTSRPALSARSPPSSARMATLCPSASPLPSTVRFYRAMAGSHRIFNTHPTILLPPTRNDDLDLLLQLSLSEPLCGYVLLSDLSFLHLQFLPADYTCKPMANHG